MEKEVIKDNVTNKAKVIKRYQNRKLYDTQQSCYVTLDDIAKMIRNQEDVIVIDNKSKNNITAATLTQIIFETEKKAARYAPLSTLKKIIQNDNGSMSGFLAYLNLFPRSQMTQPHAASTSSYNNVSNKTLSSSDSIKDQIEVRMANTKVNGLNTKTTNLKTASKLISSKNKKEDITPDLPKSNYTLTNPSS